MDSYMEQVIAAEKAKLQQFIHSAIQSFNIVGRPTIVKVEIGPYKNYDVVLCIIYKTKRVYINIDMNSVLATARTFSNYIYNDTCQGLIEVVY